MRDHRLIVIRTDANRELGYGHLMRCLSVAKKMRQRKFEIKFVLGYFEQAARDLISKEGFDLECLPGESRLDNEVKLTERYGLAAADAVLVDICHGASFQNAGQLPKFFRSLTNRLGPVVIFDGAGEHSLMTNPNVQCEIAIAPYPGVERTAPDNAKTLLAGLDYVVLPADFAEQGNQHGIFRETADRIFITFGGSDPCGLSVTSLKALDVIEDRSIQVRVALGNGFTKELREQIRLVAKEVKFDVEMLDGPTSLLPHMLWCDIAISATGLTKYELAVTGTPSVQLSTDLIHARVNEPFAAAETAVHLGVHTDVEPEALGNACISLLDDPGIRMRMGGNGKALVDGKGVDRIADAIEELGSA
jgi:spore coat polysaccharide biosynthesis predicted glycosyltransferase SpsG